MYKLFWKDFIFMQHYINLSDNDVIMMSENSGDIIVSASDIGVSVSKGDILDIHFSEDEKHVIHRYKVKNIIVNNVYLEYVEQIEDKALLEAGFFDKLKNMFNKPVDMKAGMAKSAAKNSAQFEKVLNDAMKLIVDEYGPKGRNYTYYLQKKDGNYMPGMNQDKAKSYYDKILNSPNGELTTSIANAVVVNEQGKIVRRGLENLKGSQVFDPENIQIRQGYAFPEGSIIKKGKVDNIKKSTQNTTETSNKEETSNTTSSEPVNITDKEIELTKKFLLSIGVRNLEDEVGDDVSLDKLFKTTASNYYFLLDGGNKKVRVSDWIQDAKKDGLLKESFLNESPVVKLTADDYNNPDKVDLRHNLDTAIQNEKDAEDARLRSEKQSALMQKYRPAIEQLEKDLQNSVEPEVALDNIFGMLVPPQGAAETVAGELVRAVMRILYRNYNDGDKFFEGYGLETCGSSAEYLYDHGFDSRIQSILDDAEDLSDDDDDYSDMLDALTEEVLDHLYNNQELFGEENTEDSRDYSSDYISEHQPTYEYTIEAPYEVSDILDKGLATAWDLNSYVEESIEYENAMRGCEVDRPWSSSSSTVTISNLTKDGYERAEQIFNTHFWEDFISEYEEEYTEDDDSDEFESDDSYEEEI